MREVPILVTTAGRTVRANEGEVVEKGRRYKAPKYKISLVRDAGSYWTTDRQVSNPSSARTLAWQILQDIGFDREYFYIIALDVKSKVIGVNLVSMGAVSASIVHPREVFKALIMLNASTFIAFHNHPSGSIEPSAEDLMLTSRLSEASAIIGIKMVDHVIIGDAPDKYYSFSAQGIIK